MLRARRRRLASELPPELLSKLALWMLPSREMGFWPVPIRFLLQPTVLSLSGFKLGDDLKMVAKTVTVWPVSLDGCSLGGAAKATSAGVETSVGQEKMRRR